MSVVAIFSGSYCQADEVAQRVAGQLGYQLIGNSVIEQVSRQINVPLEKFLKSLLDPPSFLNRFTRDRERHSVYLKAALAEALQKDNVVYHGFATLLLPKTISHILKVCISADFAYRVSAAARLKGISEKEADRLVRMDESRNSQWSHFVLNRSPWDEELYDVVIPMNSSTIDQAVEIICSNARKEAVQPTAQSQAAMADFVLASRVSLALVSKGQVHEIEVKATGGDVNVIINKYISRIERKKKELTEVAAGVAGVKNVSVSVGPKFNMPSIYPPEDFELPKKILLVDDEKEFVHTLSERLQSRSMESVVVYDGEEALSFVNEDQPEVIVLDLKMPGIDGIEVLRQVKKSHPETEVIILTGHGSEREEALAKELGAFAYLQKPVDIDKLSTTMKEAYKKIQKARESTEGDQRAGA